MVHPRTPAAIEGSQRAARGLTLRNPDGARWA